MSNSFEKVRATEVVSRPALLVVVAHPDDEILGAGIWLHRHVEYDRHILYLTDGSPRDMQDARAAGFATRRSYAAARRRELRDALEMVSIPRRNCYRCDYPDKEAYLHLPALIERVDRLIEVLRPSVVLSHAYEGGHPDHDAAAFADCHGAQGHATQIGRSFRHLEFPLYHAGANGEMVANEFLTRRFTSGGRPGIITRRTGLKVSHVRVLSNAKRKCCASSPGIANDFARVQITIFPGLPIPVPCYTKVGDGESRDPFGGRGPAKLKPMCLAPSSAPVPKTRLRLLPFHLPGLIRRSRRSPLLPASVTAPSRAPSIVGRSLRQEPPKKRLLPSAYQLAEFSCITRCETTVVIIEVHPGLLYRPGQNSISPNCQCLLVIQSPILFAGPV